MQYDEIITWSEMYDTTGFGAKKMIVNCLISRIEVYRNYKLHIDFKLTLNNSVKDLILPHKQETRFLAEASFYCWLKVRGSSQRPFGCHLGTFLK